MTGGDSLIGQTISHYRILEKIGAGGMGEVYRAYDERLERDVALKVLRPGMLNGEPARKRFRKEALALSKLNHPNIATVHDFDTQEGMDFLIMEYVAGETMRDKLHGGSLEEKEVARLGLQLAEGLAAAHEQGIIHRDLKPSNTRLTIDGRLKILDFGLAKLVQSPTEATETAKTISMYETQGFVGTLPYMAPEQLRGELVDARTDIWSAGGLLYRMATGRAAFPDVESARLITSILTATPTPPRVVKQHLSSGLENTILKCLEKDPGDRYQSAKELVVDLRRLLTPSTATQVIPRRKMGTSKKISLVAASVLVVLALILGFNPEGIRDKVFGGEAHAPIRSLVVLPLANLSGDPEQEYFADGMTEALITDLSQIRSLKVISRASSMRYKETKKTLPQIAQELRVDGVVQGAVMRVGDRIRISAQLIYGPNDKNLWAENYERDFKDVLALQGDVAQAIAREIKVNLEAQEQARVTTTHSADFAAHDAFLKGRYHLQQGTEDQMREAKAYFEDAVRIDPNYAAAYAGLADYYTLTNELSPRVAMPRANKYVQKALALDENLPDAHATLAYINFYGDWDWPSADKEFNRAIELSPSYAEAHRSYSEFLSEMGKHDQALAEIRTALELDPLSTATILDSGWAFYYARDYTRAIEQCGKVLDLDPHSVSARDCIGSAHLATAAYDQAISEFSVLVMSSGNDPLRLASLGCAYAASGRKPQAQKVVAQLYELSKIHYVPPYFLGQVHAALGDNDAAMSWLEKAYEQHDSYLVRIKVDPVMDPLRSDPRFEQLQQRMRL